MFNPFKKKNIKVEITKTPNEKYLEDYNYNEAKRKASICPHCKYNISNYKKSKGRGEYQHMYHSKCDLCGTEWTTYF